MLDGIRHLSGRGRQFILSAGWRLERAAAYPAPLSHSSWQRCPSTVCRMGACAGLLSWRQPGFSARDDVVQRTFGLMAGGWRDAYLSPWRPLDLCVQVDASLRRRGRVEFPSARPLKMRVRLPRWLVAPFLQRSFSFFYRSARIQKCASLPLSLRGAVNARRHGLFLRNAGKQSV